jgi:hypothetical protein
MKKFRRAASSSLIKGLASIVDSFDRSKSSSLGAPSGDPTTTWTNQAGTFGINSNRATATSSVASQPIATLTFGKDTMTVGVDGVGGGYGTAFWVTDSNNWWATYVDITQTCSTCYNTSNCSAYSYFVSFYQSVGYNYANFAYTPTQGACPGGWTSGIPWFVCDGDFNDCCSTYFNANRAYTTVYGMSCNAYNASTPFTCNCVNNYTVKLLKKISGTLSTVATFSFGAVIAGFETLFNSSTGSITVRAYSGANYASKIGSDQSTTASGFTASKKHGIMATSVTYSPAQGSSIDSFKAS